MCGWLALVGLLLALLAPPGARAAAQPQVSASRVVRLDAAQSVAAPAPRFPAQAATVATRLPDDWSHSRPRQAGPVWYRVGFDAPGVHASGALLALLIDRVCSRVEVFLNGELLHSDGALGQSATRNCQRPQLVALPSALLRDAGNTLDLKVEGRPLAQVASQQRAAGLSALQIGPYATLLQREAMRTTWRISLPEAVSATLLLLGCVLFVMGWRHRRERHLAYFGALSITWAAITARLWLHELPLPAHGTEVLLTGLMPFSVLCGMQFLLRHAGRRFHTITVALWLQCVLVPSAVLAFGPSHVFVVATLSYALLAFEMLAALAYYLRVIRAEQPGEFVPMAVLLGLLALLGLGEIAAQQFEAGRFVGDLAHVAIPVVFIAIGLRLIQHYAQALQTAEEGRLSLEARIREATAEIERNFAQLAELRVEQVTERERKRIAADLHDDLGAKLLTIVHTSESERISTLAREALEEMRLSVRGLTGRPVRLIDALGDWRAEVVSRLAQAGIEADWVAPEDAPPTLSARAYVQTTRILREAVSNIIKHSGASHCTVSCALGDDDFHLVVQDNGRGIPMELDGRLDRGHGMSSMKHRAKQLQGQCLVESGPGYGTVIRLTLPL
jgi:signal transduction histidine kinase